MPKIVVHLSQAVGKGVKASYTREYQGEVGFATDKLHKDNIIVTGELWITKKVGDGRVTMAMFPSGSYQFVEVVD